MNWVAVTTNTLLRNLPFKIELDKFGKIIMSPKNNKQGNLQFKIGFMIEKHKGTGHIIMECSIDTIEGVKVADVAWASDKFIESFGFQTPYPQAPEICVEIVSPSSSKGEIEEKVNLYLAKGAKEVWVCGEDGQIMYFSHTGQNDKSKEVDVKQ